MSKKGSKTEKMEKVTAPAEMFACLDDKGENYIVEIELPGVDKKNIELSMHEDMVIVRAERKDIMFLGHLHFPLKVNPKKAEATFKQGLLAVHVPVKEKRAPPTIVKIK
jgi:HSP20 family molecular chaperone IbpA